MGTLKVNNPPEAHCRTYLHVNREGYLRLVGSLISDDYTEAYFTEEHLIKAEMATELNGLIHWMKAGVAGIKNVQERKAVELKYSLKTPGGKLQLLDAIKVDLPKFVRGKITNHFGVTRIEANLALTRGMRQLRLYRQNNLEPLLN
jgi:hypothetical protein